MAKAIKKQVLGRGLSAILDESKIENSKNEASVGSIVLLGYEISILMALVLEAIFTKNHLLNYPIL